jgi:anti-sigma-K factor RskA
VFPQAAGLDQRLGDLEAQIERLTLALVRWREAEEHRQPAERRLALLTEQCADILKQWTATSERHAQAVSELESRLTGWNDIEGRLQREASSRFQGLERAIEREWASLRHMHEEPARELRQQAETLTEISVNAAGSAQTGLERAEARLSMLEHELHRRMDDLARDIHSMLAELRQHGASGLRNPASAWSLDEVTRLHQELRGGENSGTVLDQPAQSSSTGSTRLAIAPAVVDASAEPARPDVEPAPQPEAEAPAAPATAIREPEPITDISADDRSSWKWYAALAVVILVIAITGAFALSFYNKANEAAARAGEAQQRAERIATTASARIDAARQDAATQITQAREVASKAQVTTDVLAASDLVRFNLTVGEGATRIPAQLLWSRSRGMVFTASRMPAPAAGTVYQIWLLTASDPVSAGTVVPDSSGRVTFATDTPPSVPRPLVGVRVTSEPAPGGLRHREGTLPPLSARALHRRPERAGAGRGLPALGRRTAPPRPAGSRHRRWTADWF